MKEKIRYYLKVFALSVLPSFIIFTVAMFPYSELSNLVTSQVAKLTANQVILQFKDMGFQFIPSLGLDFQDVSVKGTMLPELTMDNLNVSPSISGLLAFKPGVRIGAQGLYGGDLLINTKGEEDNSKGMLKHGIDIEASKILVGSILKEINIPIKVNGELDLDLNGVIDPSFVDEPDLNLDLNISPFKLSGGNINTGVMGDISLPPLNLKRAVFKGNLKNNKLKISNLQIGGSDEAVQITVKGNLDLRIQAGPRGPMPRPGAYEVEIEINAGPEFEKDFGLYLGFLEQYKRPSGNRNIYSMKLSGLDFRRQPKMQ
ncbi:MAG: type II secretion system protein GspN [Bdellovibrionota bacterium]|nr:type II secretion system protein GspN [Bdellovibrionota bacterium]